MKTIMMIAIMKVRGVTTFYTSDNGSNDENDDAATMSLMGNYTI